MRNGEAADLRFPIRAPLYIFPAARVLIISLSDSGHYTDFQAGLFPDKTRDMGEMSRTGQMSHADATCRDRKMSRWRVPPSARPIQRIRSRLPTTRKKSLIRQKFHRTESAASSLLSCVTYCIPYRG